MAINYTDYSEYVLQQYLDNLDDYDNPYEDNDGGDSYQKEREDEV